MLQATAVTHAHAAHRQRCMKGPHPHTPAEDVVQHCVKRCQLFRQGVQALQQQAAAAATAAVSSGGVQRECHVWEEEHRTQRLAEL
jgi:hypothetical protein